LRSSQTNTYSTGTTELLAFNHFFATPQTNLKLIWVCAAAHSSHCARAAEIHKTTDNKFDEEKYIKEIKERASLFGYFKTCLHNNYNQFINQLIM